MDKELQTSIKIAERSPYRLSLKAIVSGSAMSAGDLDTSYRLLMECLSFMPAYLPTQRLMSVNRLLARDFELALQEFDHLLLLNPSSRIGMFGASLLMCKFGRIKQATENLLDLMDDEVFGEVAKELVFLAYGKEAANHSKTEEYVSRIRKERAKTAHDMLTELGTGSENVRLKITLTRQLIERGEKNTARNILTRLMDSYPHYPELLSLLADMREASDSDENASALRQTIFDIQPTYSTDDKFLTSIEYRYANLEDIPALSELDDWCESVLTQFARGQIIPSVANGETESPKDRYTGIKKSTAEDIKPAEEKSPVETLPPPPEPEPEPEPIESREKEELTQSPLPDSDSADAHQLDRARNILEHARKLLDQTKLEGAKKEQTETKPIPKTLQKPEDKEQPKQEVEEAIERPPQLIELDNKLEHGEETVPVGFTSDMTRESITFSVDDQEAPEEKAESAQEPEEPIITEDVPERVVLPTSETQSDYSEEGAWKLLKEGSAEEAFFIFSKLVRKHFGGDQ